MLGVVVVGGWCCGECMPGGSQSPSPLRRQRQRDMQPPDIYDLNLFLCCCCNVHTMHTLLLLLLGVRGELYVLLDGCQRGRPERRVS